LCCHECERTWFEVEVKRERKGEEEREEGKEEKEKRREEKGLKSG
jgi:hypothetical protein